MENICSVLIIGGDVDDYDLCRRMLMDDPFLGREKSIFQLDYAKSFGAGLKKIQLERPDCVLLCSQLMDDDVFSALEDIRKNFIHLPVIIFVYQTDETIAVDFLRSGAQDYIFKEDMINSSVDEVIFRAIAACHVDLIGRSDAGSSLLVLVVDDNEDDRELIQRSLKKITRTDYFVVEARSGTGAMKCIAESTPNCVLLDYSLPGENGIEVLRKINDKYPFLPVIIISGEGSERVAVDAIKGGAFNYLVKSEITPDILENAIKSGLEHKNLKALLDEKNMALKHYQQEVVERQQLLERVVWATDIVVWEIDLKKNSVVVGKNILSLLGYDVGQDCFPLSVIYKMVHPEDFSEMQKVWESHLKSESACYECIYRMRHANGSWRWIKDMGKAIKFDSDGGPTHVAGIYQDVTELKKEEIFLNRLYLASFDGDLSVQDKINEVLRLGLEYFELELAIVSKVVGEECHIIYCDPCEEFFPGYVFPISETYCNYLYGSRDIKAWHFVGDTDIGNKPCYQNLKIETYIGTSLFVNGEAFGTINFTKKARREKPFSHREKSFLRLIAQWISSEISRVDDLKKIESSEAFLQLIQDTIPDLIFVKDDQRRVVRANPAFFKLYPKKYWGTLLGVESVDPYTLKEVQSCRAIDEKVLSDGFFEAEENVTSFDGKVRTLYTKKIRFKDSEGSDFILGVGRDITEIKKAQNELKESEERFDLAVKGSNIGIWTLEIDTNEFYVSPKIREILGYDDNENAFPNFFEGWLNKIHPDDVQGFIDSVQNHITNGIAHDVEYRVFKKNGDWIWACSKGEAQRNAQGRAKRMAGSFEDITTRKIVVDELVRANQEMERFAYVASHDLQEPLRMVISFTELLQKNYGEQLDERAREYIQYASGGAKRMQQLVRDLLEYARARNEAENHQQVNLNNILQSAVDNLHASIEDTCAKISWGHLPCVRANPARMRSIFQNLIGNAIKYRQKDVSPVVDVCVEESSEGWLFIVKDNGIGMKQQYCTQIFEPFKRLHRKSEYAGTGMGLSICRKIVEDLGGKIWAESEQKLGSVFYFTIPVDFVNEE